MDTGTRPTLQRLKTDGLALMHLPLQEFRNTENPELSALEGSFQLQTQPDSDFSGTVSAQPLSPIQLENSYVQQSSPISGPFISRRFLSNNIGTDRKIAFPSSFRAQSSLDSSGPSSPSLTEDDSESSIEADSEDAWNLIPYDIAWGSSYYGYKKSDCTLPGPDGKCIFLRSPTPLKYQRTGQACEKCRERKAKVNLILCA